MSLEVMGWESSRELVGCGFILMAEDFEWTGKTGGIAGGRIVRGGGVIRLIIECFPEVDSESGAFFWFPFVRFCEFSLYLLRFLLDLCVVCPLYVAWG